MPGETDPNDTTLSAPQASLLEYFCIKSDDPMYQEMEDTPINTADSADLEGGSLHFPCEDPSKRNVFTDCLGKLDEYLDQFEDLDYDDEFYDDDSITKIARRRAIARERQRLQRQRKRRAAARAALGGEENLSTGSRIKSMNDTEPYMPNTPVTPVKDNRSKRPSIASDIDDEDIILVKLERNMKQSGDNSDDDDGDDRYMPRSKDAGSQNSPDHVSHFEDKKEQFHTTLSLQPMLEPTIDNNEENNSASQNSKLVEEAKDILAALGTVKSADSLMRNDHPTIKTVGYRTHILTVPSAVSGEYWNDDNNNNNEVSDEESVLSYDNRWADIMKNVTTDDHDVDREENDPFKKYRDNYSDSDYEEKEEEEEDDDDDDIQDDGERFNLWEEKLKMAEDSSSVSDEQSISNDSNISQERHFHNLISSSRAEDDKNETQKNAKHTNNNDIKMKARSVSPNPDTSLSQGQSD